MGPSLPNGEPAIDTWRTQLQSDERERIINMITETLKKQHLPFSGPQGINEHRKIASRFEDKVFSNAADLNDYLGIISIEMLSIETTVKNAADSAASIPTANYSTPLNSGSLMDNNNWRPSSLPYREPTVDTGDWRTQLPPDARLMIVNSITETLEKHHSGAEGINRRIAATLEENIFNSADHQTDYLRKIFAKMLAMETKSQNTGDWRSQQPPDSRQKNVNKLMETLKKHVPYSGQEGIDELMRIAVSFEELIFNTAINQVDYFRKISFKILAMEEGN